MNKRYCDRCGQQIDEGVHAWYVLELHGTDGEFRHKELCEECYESLAEDNYIPRIEHTEPQTENPCDGCVCDDGKHLMYCMNCKGIAWQTEPPKYEAEPQTEADWKDKMWAEAVQADCTTCDQVGRCERDRAVECPLTERSE